MKSTIKKINFNKSLIKKLYNEKITILYATQTGTTEKYAKSLYNSARARKLNPEIYKMDDFDFENSLNKKQTIIFLLSTFYNGEFPDNASKFWKHLSNQSIEKSFLSPLTYSVFGLGNSSFKDTFTRSARLLDDRIEKLGGKKLIISGYGDEYDINGIESGYKPWVKRLWKELGVSESVEIPLNYSIKTLSEYDNKKSSDPIQSKDFEKFRVVKNELLTGPKADKPVYNLTINISDKDIKYNPGDKIMVQPTNSDEIVNRAAQLLGISNVNQLIEIKQLSSYSTVYPKKCSIRNILQSYLDLSSIPSRSFLEEISLLAQNKEEKIELENLATDLLSGNLYSVKSLTERFSILDILEKFKSVKLSLELLMTIVPVIFPRYYSICSSQLKNHYTMEIEYNLETKQCKDNKLFKGLATSYMSNLKENDFITLSRPKNIEMIDETTKDIFLIGLGSGLGVIRGILENRYIKKKSNLKIGKATLFVGVRHKNDFIYEEELRFYEKQGIVDIIEAYSMENGNKTVIDTIKENSDLVSKVFKNKDIQYFYCGLGGLIPNHIEQAIILAINKSSNLGKLTINKMITEMKINKVWNVEGFSVNLDEENYLKNTLLKKQGKLEISDTKSIYDQFSGSKMFCFQCEQTNAGKGCTTVGVCGKTPEVAALQDLLVDYIKRMSWFAHILRKNFNYENEEINRLSLISLFSTLTNVNFDAKRIIDYINEVRAKTKELNELYLIETQKTQNHIEEKIPEEDSELSKISGNFSIDNIDLLTKKGESYGVLKKYFTFSDDSVVGLQEMLVYGLKGISAYADHALMQGLENKEIYSFIHEALYFLTSKNCEDIGKNLEMLMKCGLINYKTMELLHQANTKYGVQTPQSVSTKPEAGKCIMISGHDLKMLEELLKQLKDSDINVYTHGEMLPAHGYEKLRAFKNLKGHLGGAWQKQSLEFAKFPGPIVMTTNCLTQPKEEYKDRIFTVGAVGWPNIRHISEKNLDFSEVIKLANKSEGFVKNNLDVFGDSKNLLVGFGHETVISVADKVLESVKNGDITRFYVIGGCDGFEGERSYYTEFAKILPKTSVILTVGCGKFRINGLDYESIGNTGIPRLLDLGQCNDSYSAIQIALALKNATGVKDVNDLPISIILSWFEQKAIAVLLSLLSLGIKNIHIGPQAPGFITPQVLKVLTDNFNLKLVGDPKEDLNKILKH